MQYLYQLLNNFLFYYLMKRFLYLFIVLATSFFAKAQGDLVVFSENGEQFYLVINGEKHNKTPETNVKAFGLTQQFVKVKVVFADGALGEVSQNTPIEPGMETTLMVKQNNKGVYKLAWRGTAPSTQTAAAPMNPQMSPATQGMRQLPPPPPPPAPPVQTYPASSGTVTTQTQTTTTTMGTPMPGIGIGATIDDGMGGQVSVGVNVGGMGMGMQVTESQTTTTTTNVNVNTNAYPPQQTYPQPPPPPPAPAYQPQCYAMDQVSFGNALASIKKASFSDTKLTIAKQVIGSNCVSSAQVKSMMGEFDFEDTKLQFAKLAYPKVVDPQNYYMINDGFEFESSTEELAKFIGQ
jgi:Domain of unknown function (DUF4476)